MTDEPDAWAPRCVLCSRPVDTGHCCAVCRTRIRDDLASILANATSAAAFVTPGSSGPGRGSSVPGSRPPLNVDALDPELAVIRLNPDDPSSDQTVLEVLESWERLIRDERGFVPYGLASESRAIAGQTTLTGCVGFLAAQVDYATTEPTFGIEQFAREIRLCARALRRWDMLREADTTWRVDCPADLDGTTCGRPLRVGGEDVERYFRCPTCGTEWSVHRLLLVAAETSDAAMWLDADAIIARTGISRRTLDRWVAHGLIARRHGLYDARPILVGRHAETSA